jgi:1-acyl-sn-glycerol-3-phosphate acyltransferase
MMRASDAAVTLRFAPRSFAERWRFHTSGRWLLVRAFRELAGAPADATAAQRHQWQSLWAAEIVAHLRVRLAVRWRGEAPREPAIIIALHESVADALFLLRLGMPMRFVARQELFAWPGVGPALARMRHVAINPERGTTAYRTMLRAAHETVAAGESFAVFPQGTLLGIEAAFRVGGFRLARALNLPIQPVVISGSHRIWEHPFSPRLRYDQEVAIDVLPRIAAPEVAATDTAAMCRRVERQMKQIALEYGRPAPRRYQPHCDGFWDGYAFEIDDQFPELRGVVAAHRHSWRSAIVRDTQRQSTPQISS